jgi:DNA-directed RNA polymerase beta' subunit
MDKFSKDIGEVTSSEIFISKGTYHPDGLFSEEIFGSVESPERKKSYGFITLNTSVIHPAIMPILKRVERKIVAAVYREGKYKIDEQGYLQDDKDGDIIGIKSVYDNMRKISFRGGSPQRDNLIKMFTHYIRNNQFFIDKIPVIPPVYRDATRDDSGNINLDPMNDYYKNIIVLSLQLKTSGSGVVYDILSTNMQQAVLDLYDYMSSLISKKEGLLRHDILGKRVDFSARAVITGAGYELKSDELGIPLRAIVKLFEPFILHELMNLSEDLKSKLAEEMYAYNQMELSISTLRNLLGGIYKGDEVPEEIDYIIRIGVNKAIHDKVVIAKRDPALHTESTMAFRPVLVEGNTIRLNTLMCDVFNADFDGDQMAIFTPITKEAIEEARDKMITTESKDGMNAVSLGFKPDVVAGIYTLTMEPPGGIHGTRTIRNDDELAQLDIHDGITYNGNKTTVGRVLFNKQLPNKYKFINEPVTKKKLKLITSEISIKLGSAIYRQTCDNLLKLGSYYFMVASPTFSLDDLEIPQKFYKMKEKLVGATPEQAQVILNQMEKELSAYLIERGMSLGILAAAGATKGIDQLRQVLVAKGLVTDTSGKILPPITSSYADGTKSKDFFSLGPACRSGIMDRVLNTATTGYLARQLIYALQSVEVNPKITDCKTKRHLIITAVPEIARRLEGRLILTKGGGYRLFNPATDTGKVIYLRSPMYCQSRQLCLRCYGQLALRNTSPYVGITAGSIIGERGSQIIMKSFHTGGAVTIRLIDVFGNILKYFDAESKTKFVKMFTQKENSVIANTDGLVIINKNDFMDVTNDIQIDDNSAQLYYGYITLKVLDREYDLTLDYNTEIPILHGYEEEAEDKIIIPFKKGETVFSCTQQQDAQAKKIKIVEAVLSGRKAWKNEVHFLLKIFDQYSADTDCDFVHFEVLVSNLVRDANNLRIPARLNRKEYKPVIGNIKAIPSYESWLSSLSFENFNKSIETALVYPRPPEESILEKIVTGNL